MNSPYYQGLMPANWGPPPGYLQALMQRNENNNRALEQIGRFTGAMGSGIGGAMLANRNQKQYLADLAGGAEPTASPYGQEVTPGGAGVRGFLSNFNAGFNGGGGEPSMSRSMNRAMGAAGGGNQNYEQQATQAKALRTAVLAFAPKDAEGNLTAEGKAIVAKANASGLPDLVGMVENHVMERKQRAEDAKLSADQQRQQLLAAQLGDFQRKQQQSEAFRQALGAQQSLAGNRQFNQQAGQPFMDLLKNGQETAPAQADVPGLAFRYLDPESAGRVSENFARAMELTGRTQDPLRAQAYATDRMNAETNAKLAELRKRELENPTAKPQSPGRVTVKADDGSTFTGTPEQAAAFQKANPTAKAMRAQGDRVALEEELAQHQAAMKSGDNYYGFLGAQSRSKQIVAIKRKLAELGTSPAATAAAPYPEGTRLTGPGGKPFIVKNGQPVPE